MQFSTHEPDPGNTGGGNAIFLIYQEPSSGLEEDFLLRVLIFANGELKGFEALQIDIKQDDLIIAADGGAVHCHKLGLTPSLVIGDMDSIPPTLLEQLTNENVQIINYPQDKDETDLELALSHAVKNGADQIFLYGLFGGRLDQSLSNLFLLTRVEWEHVDLIVSHGSDTAYLLAGGEDITLHGNPGDLISLIPVTSSVSGVTTHGLRWRLTNAKLIRGTTLSISNEMAADFASVKIESGKMILIHRNQQVDESEE